MQSYQARGLQAFRRVTAWFVEHPQVIANSGSSSAALASQVDALKQVVDSMTAGATEQTTQTSQATLAAKDETDLRTELRSVHVKAIVKIAGGLRGKVPGMGVFRQPSQKLRSEKLLHAAEAIRATAGIYKDVFTEHGLPADFLDQLDSATSALRQSVDARGVARSRVTAASTTLATDLKLGRQIVTMIDASLTHALKSDPAMLASWRQAKRATIKGVTSRTVVPVVPIQPSAAPVVGSVESAVSSAVPATTPSETKAA